MARTTRSLAPSAARPAAAPERLRRYRRGLLAELIAEARLWLTGHVVLERRYRTPLGEIDLIAVRGRRLVFCEVKHRSSLELAAESVTPRLMGRVRRAAAAWLQRHPRYGGHEQGFDLMLIAPGRLPRHVRDAFPFQMPVYRGSHGLA